MSTYGCKVHPENSMVFNKPVKVYKAVFTYRGEGADAAGTDTPAHFAGPFSKDAVL